MYDALTIARYIVNYSNDKDYGVTNLKLQKLLYFVQAAFLSVYDEKCFKEDIEAWKFGPVVNKVYHEFKQYGNRLIPTITEYSDVNYYVNGKLTPFDDSVISNEHKAIINQIIDFFSEYSASMLVEITHAQGPWRKVYDGNWNAVITEDDLKGVFK